MKKMIHGRSSALVGFLLAGVLVAACGTGEAAVPDETTPPRGATVLLDAASSPFPSGRIFSDESPFNQPIPENPRLHPDSTELVQTLVDRTPDGFVISVEQWTVAAFVADDSTRLVDVRLTADWAPFRLMRNVPIPPDARPDPEDDGSLTVIDLAGGYAYDFWQARKTADGWEASWGNRVPLDGTGVYPNGYSARGSGFPLLGGLIWPQELAAGRIDHALIFIYLPNRANYLAWPATETDGTSGDPLTLPEGARLQLNPDLDLDTLGLSGPERTIAVALQEYGMILGDAGGTPVVELQAVHPFSFGLPADELYSWEMEEGFAFLPGIPLSEFRVLHYELIPSDSLEYTVSDPSIYAGPAD